MRYFSYLSNASQLLEQYQGKVPFSIFLKQFFSRQKKFGSNDRRQIARLCYGYFRLGHSLRQLPLQERILAGVFVSAQGPEELLEQLKPEWNALTQLPVTEKLALAAGGEAAPAPAGTGEAELANIFPWADRLSEGIDTAAFRTSFGIQPDLFLRLRPGKEAGVQRKLQLEGLSFEVLGPQCLALPNSSRADKVLDIDQEAVIQDHSSQRVGELLLLVKDQLPEKPAVWDCCSGSGGKSIMAWDLLGPSIRLTVSDKRESIIHNLQERFRLAGMLQYKALVTDLTQLPPDKAAVPGGDGGKQLFPLIIADVPCTGSGTWGRTPDQLFFFAPEGIRSYSERQKKIVQAALRQLAPGGYFLYITCSVFREENEDMIAFIQANSTLQLVKKELFTGYQRKADTLFAALFQSNTV
ncbi:MAG: Fmu (Sun) domain-containing protein [Candidatus Pseudobacter hemicellulosilyticus]|uniref:Fmu (Sun) domain-containing protein n=1 Tax=Candidatus Pseudobacter hemicellulosilyticus TaxID=3121375 RepID=A0AAJ5WPF2_9BACT|nr:MAG: Fmu (Sun) domain-containing protein [Pseudobacter sp.]